MREIVYTLFIITYYEYKDKGMQHKHMNSSKLDLLGCETLSKDNNGKWKHMKIKHRP